MVKSFFFRYTKGELDIAYITSRIIGKPIWLLLMDICARQLFTTPTQFIYLFVAFMSLKCVAKNNCLM